MKAKIIMGANPEAMGNKLADYCEGREDIDSIEIIHRDGECCNTAIVVVYHRTPRDVNPELIT